MLTDRPWPTSFSSCQSIKILLQVPGTPAIADGAKRDEPSHGIPRFWVPSPIEPFLRSGRLVSQSRTWASPGKGVSLGAVELGPLAETHPPTRPILPSEMSPGPQGSHPRFANAQS